MLGLAVFRRRFFPLLRLRTPHSAPRIGASRAARLVALLDNLGKGASGAAVQNLNIMLGLDEATGLS